MSFAKNNSLFGLVISIGRKDVVNLENLGLLGIEAKVDTGAFGSALHCNYTKVQSIDGQKTLVVIFLDPSHPLYTGKEFYFKKFGEKTVKSTSGIAEERYTIQTDLSIFGNSYSVEFSLADRSSMKIPILLGRKFLAFRFVVDVSKKNLSLKQIKK